MAKYITIFYAFYTLFAGLIPAGDLKELVKTNTLFQHLKEHRLAQNQDLSFLKFLLIHYGPGENHRDQSHQEKLPWKDQNHVSVIFMIRNFCYYVPEYQHFAQVKPIFDTENYQYLSDLSFFNPPKKSLA